MQFLSSVDFILKGADPGFPEHSGLRVPREQVQDLLGSGPWVPQSVISAMFSLGQRMTHSQSWFRGGKQTPLPVGGSAKWCWLVLQSTTVKSVCMFGFFFLLPYFAFCISNGFLCFSFLVFFGIVFLYSSFSYPFLIWAFWTPFLFLSCLA